MDKSNESLLAMTVFCLRLLWDSIYHDWSKTASNAGLTVTEEQILWAISLPNSNTVTDVAKNLRRDKGTISKSIYSLEESGLLVREAGTDRRSYEFKMTKKGEDIRNRQGAPGYNSSFARVFADLSEEEQQSLVTLLVKLTKQIEGETYVADIIKCLTQFDTFANE